jgi:peptidoglycan/LPS O-acetylase OafA/YrhL
VTRARDNGFRPDIEGLRAVAIGAVLLCHAGLPFAAGGYVGVDVFFVISGYLITRLLLGELASTGAVSLLRFYARRARRLLPLAFIVLAAVTALSAWMLTPLENERVARDVVASAAYVVNWRFAGQAVDYFEADGLASPLQHFWSLAVEEQFYLLWPALLVGLTGRARRRGGDVRRALWPALTALAVGSFLHAASTDPGAVYFSTFARAWELALGGLLALALVAPPRLGARVATALAWCGLAGIAAAVAMFDDATAVPGLPALLPTLGAAAIIVAGAAPGTRSASRLLTLRPTRYVGRISYAWYLWHWPLLVLAEARWGELTVATGVAVTAASWLPTAISHRLVERPIHRSRPLGRRPAFGLAVGVVCSAGGAAAGLLLFAAQPPQRTIPIADVAGAAEVSERVRPIQRRADGVRPRPRDADGDRGQMYRDGCLVPMRETRSPRCVYGNRAATRRVVLFGDSHAMQFFPALQRIARRKDWRLVGLAKAACTAADGVLTYNRQLRRPYDECPTWRARTLRRIEKRERPDMVVVTSSVSSQVIDRGRRLDRGTSRRHLERGYVRTLRRLARTGARVVVLRDTPRAPFDVPACVSGALDRLEKCAFPLEGAIDPRAPEAAAARRLRRVRLVDTHKLLCPGGTCRAVMGNALVYRDRTHLTATFMRTAADWFGRRLPAVR